MDESYDYKIILYISSVDTACLRCCFTQCSAYSSQHFWGPYGSATWPAKPCGQSA